MAHDWISPSRLWLVLDRHAAEPRTLPEVTRLAVSGGVDAVLCRIKDAPEADVARLASEVREACRELRVPFVMSHFPDLAVSLEADAIQLGIADPPIQEVRQLIGSSMAVGFSTHGVGEAQDCLAAGADYVFVGPVFPTPEKLKYGPPLGLGVVPDAAALPGPVVFIGGINLANASSIVQAGGLRVAAIGALQRVADPRAAAMALAAELGSGRLP